LFVQTRTLTNTARRTQIVQAAARVVAREGLSRASFSRIAGEAGLSSPGLISYHFAGKDELFGLLCDTVLEDCTTTVAAAVDAADGPAAAFTAYLTASIGWQDAHRDEVTALWRLQAGWKAPGREQAFDEGRLVEPLRQVLAEGAATGVLRDLPPGWVGRAVLGAVEGFHEVLRCEPGVDAAAYADTLVQLLGHGLRVEGSDGAA
jgi:AcrR family transcriptional regulator